ncbi:MAG: hypothetical protein M5U16_14250 [Hyphomicrobium sp.]|nr:hypothetical protein [Hyphomicrobium sp.]
MTALSGGNDKSGAFERADDLTRLHCRERCVMRCVAHRRLVIARRIGVGDVLAGGGHIFEHELDGFLAMASASSSSLPKLTISGSAGTRTVKPPRSGRSTTE